MEVVYLLFRYWPLNWQGEGWNSQNARRTNSCYVPPEPRPEHIPTIWESCVKIPDILLCGRYMILYTLVCQSNIRPTPLSESNQSAKISRQHFIIGDLHLGDWVWVWEASGESVWMASTVREGEWAWVRWGRIRKIIRPVMTETAHTQRFIRIRDRLNTAELCLPLSAFSAFNTSHLHRFIKGFVEYLPYFSCYSSF